MVRPVGTGKPLKYLTVKQAIEREIINGTIGPGEQIPTIDQLVVKYGVGRSTAQRVIGELNKDGLIVCKAGNGCFVRPFVREKIRESRMGEVQTSLEAAVFHALEAGFRADEIETMVANSLVRYIAEGEPEE